MLRTKLLVVAGAVLALVGLAGTSAAAATAVVQPTVTCQDPYGLHKTVCL